MNCPYCQAECQPDRHNPNEPGQTNLECYNHKHPVQFEIYISAQYSHWYFYATQRGDRLYSVKCSRLWEGVEEMELAESSAKVLIHLDFINLNINPDNIDDKLPMLLLFM